MADIFSKKKRSEIMSLIRSKGTRPEKELYKLVRSTLKHGFTVSRNVASLPGQPDILIKRLKLAIFLDGCFYHFCPKHGHLPKSNKAFWKKKFERNVRRDFRKRRALRAAGYRVFRLWEHDLQKKNIINAHNRLQSVIHKLIESQNVQ